MRMLSLWYMAEEGRTHAWRTGALKDHPVKPHVGFLLEHPAGPGDHAGSLFQTSMWRTFATEELMGEIPCVINGRAVVLGGNLDLWHLRDCHFGALSEGDAYSSVWPMELIAHVAGALHSWTGLRNREGLLASLMRTASSSVGENVGDLAKFNVGEWRLHVQRDHLPYRKDCRICIERASGKPHRRVTHPSAYCLSIDTAGPFRNPGTGGYKYLLVGCYRHPKLPGPEEETKEASSRRSHLVLMMVKTGCWRIRRRLTKVKFYLKASLKVVSGLLIQATPRILRKVIVQIRRLRASGSWRSLWSLSRSMSPDL